MCEDRSNQKDWTLAQVHEWASEAFPDTFMALPVLENLEFVDLDTDRLKNTTFQLPKDVTVKAFVFGTYDDGTKKKARDKALAVLSGTQYNQAHYILERSDLGRKLYVRLDEPCMSRVDVVRPLDHIAHNNRRTTLDMLKSVIYYYFLASGIILQFGGFKSFAKAFELACEYVDCGRAAPEELRSDPLIDEDRPSIDIAYGEEHGADDVFVKMDDNMNLRSDDTSGDESYVPTAIATSPMRANSPQAEHSEEDRDPSPPTSSIGDKLHDVNIAYNALEVGNKRLKLELQKVRTKDAGIISELENNNKALEAKNQTLSLKLSEAENKLKKLTAERSKQTYLCNEEHVPHARAKLQSYKRRPSQALEDIIEADHRANEAKETEIKALNRERLELKARAEAAEKKLANIVRSLQD